MWLSYVFLNNHSSEEKVLLYSG